MKLLHRIAHWLKVEPCINDVERRNGHPWHVVRCTVCGEEVLAFPFGPASEPEFAAKETP